MRSMGTRRAAAVIVCVAALHGCADNHPATAACESFYDVVRSSATPAPAAQVSRSGVTEAADLASVAGEAALSDAMLLLEREVAAASQHPGRNLPSYTRAWHAVVEQCEAAGIRPPQEQRS